MINKIQIIKEMEWAQEKEIEVSIPERATYSIQQTRFIGKNPGTWMDPAYSLEKKATILGKVFLLCSPFLEIEHFTKE